MGIEQDASFNAVFVTRFFFFFWHLILPFFFHLFSSSDRTTSAHILQDNKAAETLS